MRRLYASLSLLVLVVLDWCYGFTTTSGGTARQA